MQGSYMISLVPCKDRTRKYVMICTRKRSGNSDAVKIILRRYQQYAVKKKLFAANFNAYLKFTWNIIEVSDRWRSGIRSYWHAGGEKFETVWIRLFFVRNAVKKIFLPLKTANLKKVHRIQRCSSVAPDPCPWSISVWSIPVLKWGHHTE